VNLHIALGLLRELEIWAGSLDDNDSVTSVPTVDTMRTEP
jgi:hypothetical protein